MKEEKNKISLGLLISLLLASVIEGIMVLSNTSFFSIDRLIVMFFILSFVAMNFIIKREKLYGFIIDNRFKIAGIIFLVTTILGLSFVSFSPESVIIGEYSSYNNLKYQEFRNFFDIKNEMLAEGLYVCFTNFKFVVSILVAYEFMLIITKEKFSGLVGGIVIAFSTYMLTELNMAIIFGQLALVCIYNFLIEKKEHKKEKIKLGILFIISMCLYGCNFDLSSVIAYGYIIVAIYISFLLLLKKDKKLEKSHLIKSIILITVSFMIITVFHIVMVNIGYEKINVFEEKTNKVGRIMGYGIGVVETFKPINNPESWTTFINIFPLPILLALVYMYKKEEEFEFLFPLSVVMIIQIVSCSIGLPGVLNKVLGYAFVAKDISAVMVSLINVYMMFYIISHLKERAISFMTSIYIPLIIIVVYCFIGKPVGYDARSTYTFFIMIMVIPSLLISNYTDVRYKRMFKYSLVLLTILAGVTINPITKAKYLDFTKYNEKNYVRLYSDNIENKE